MRFKAIVSDYDGTLASNDRLGPEARAALEGAREAGLRLVLVTGRTLFDLTRVCDRLDLFDAVVAENGAVLYFPPAGTLLDQAPPPPSRVLAELDRRGIAYQLGRAIVGVARANEAGVREALAATGVQLDVVYNRGAMMLLPQGVTKGTGVRQALRDLDLSPHDVVALGDAENDLPLFEECGFAGCPADAVPDLRARADWVLPGHDGEAIAAAIRGPILGGQLRTDTSPRHRIELGWAVGTGERVAVPRWDVNVLIHGDPASGKSWLAGALVERLVEQRCAVCVIDPEGDYGVLARLPGVARIEILDPASVVGAVGRLEHEPSASVVADLSALPHADKGRCIDAALGAARDLRRRVGRPHWIVLDEAHYSLHGGGGLDLTAALAAKGFCLVTYRSSWLRPPVLASIDVLVLARTTEPGELARLGDLLGGPADERRQVAAALPDLPWGQFVLVQRGLSPGVLTFAPVPRLTRHVRHRRKYADSEVTPHQRFVFRQPDGRVVAIADSLGAFRAAAAAVPEEVLAYHAERGDFSRWVLDVFSDPTLGSQLRKLEARWARGEIPALRPGLRALIGYRYGAEA